MDNHKLSIDTHIENIDLTLREKDYYERQFMLIYENEY